MKPFEFLDHTADAKWRAYGKTLEEAFTNSAYAFVRLMTEDEIQEKETKAIQITTNKKESLLFDFIEELIFLVDTEGFILAKVKEIAIKKQAEGTNQTYTLTAQITGDNAQKYDIATQIKAMTYSDMIIDEKEDKVMIQAVPDL